MEVHRFPAEPAKIRDDHFQMNDEWALSATQIDQVRHDLAWRGEAPMQFVPGPLEDWIESALALDGKSGFCAIPQSDCKKTLPIRQQEKCSWLGPPAARRTRGTTISSSRRTSAHLQDRPAARLSRRDPATSWILTRRGSPRLSLQGADAKGSRTAAVAVNDGKWHHVIAEADRSNAEGGHLYVDGALHDGAWAGIMPKASLSNAEDFVVGKACPARSPFCEYLRERCTTQKRRSRSYMPGNSTARSCAISRESSPLANAMPGRSSTRNSAAVLLSVFAGCSRIG